MSETNENIIDACGLRALPRVRLTQTDDKVVVAPPEGDDPDSPSFQSFPLAKVP